MALPKIPDLILEKLRCNCGRYLSTSPINVNQDGKSVCSDCVDTAMLGVEGTTRKDSAYETIAELFQFPCRYKTKGCPKYMPFNIIAKHEEECTFHTYKCPQNLLTYCNVVDSVAQLCNHYQQHHPELYLGSPIFAVDLNTDSEKYYLTTVDNYTYLLQSKCSIKQNKLWLQANHFKSAEDTMHIQYQIKIIDSNNRERCVELEKKCVEVFNNVLLNPSQAVEVDTSAVMSLFKNSSINCFWKITVAKELKLKTIKQKEVEDQEAFKEQKESVKCPHCGVYMIPPIYRCDKDHIKCEECRGYYDDCQFCQSNEVKWTRATDLENIITKMAQYHCRWIKCNKVFFSYEIRIHEQECSYRRYKCPNCNWLGVYNEILPHFHSLHSRIKIYSENTITFNSNDCYIYIITHHEMFFLRIEKDQIKHGNLYMYLNYLGSPRFVNDWEFIIKEDNIDNKTHKLVKHSNNCYAGNFTFGQKTNLPSGLSISSSFCINYQLSINRN